MYRIVVAEKTAAVKGQYQEILGHFKPALGVPEVIFEKERIQYWIKNGARPSPTVARLLHKQGLEEMVKFYDAKKKYNKKSKKEAKAAAAAAGAPAAPAADAKKPEEKKPEEKKPEEKKAA